MKQNEISEKSVKHNGNWKVHDVKNPVLGSLPPSTPVSAHVLTGILL
jgi:hypothetical protein